jgi:hypothetical protein
MFRKVKRKRKRKNLRRFLSLNLEEEGVEEDLERSQLKLNMLLTLSSPLGKLRT